MRVAIETLGTRGDVQPYVALARGLIARGHDVQLAAPVQFADFAAANGVAFAGLPGEFLALLDTPEGKAAIAGSEGFAAGFKLLKYVRPMMRKLFDDEWAAVQAFHPDIVIYHPKSLAAPMIATALRVPHVLASPLPGFTPTSRFPSPLLPFASLGPLNRASHALAIRGAELMFGGDLKRWRTDNGIADGRPRPPSGTLYAYSREVLPVPADWGHDVLVSGYWFLDVPEWAPDAALTAFLDAGEAPVYVGFGSMPGLDAERLTSVVTEALAKTGKRGLLATGGGALAGMTLPAHVHQIQGAPHDRLLPLVSATVHHGGAGTTAASLRAGIPTTIMPFFGDQPFWARRIVELGAGPPALDRKALTAERLASALVAMDSPEMRRRAAEIGRAIRAEDGVSTAIAFIEERVRAPD